MATYVALLSWTEQGVKSAKETVDRYEAARESFAGLGVTLKETLWTTGAYDIVAIADAPDDESMAAATLALAGGGNVRTTTMRAFSAEEMRRVLDKIPG